MERPGFDDLLAADIAERAEAAGAKKAQLPSLPMFLLAVLAGGFIALGANFYTITLVGAQAMPWGVAKTLGGVAFSLGLILVVVAGAELFTGNNLIVMAVASRRATLRALARNWGIVYAGNFVGALATAGTMFLAGQYTFAGGQVGVVAMQIADHKCALPPVQAFFLACYCNALVCLAVWLSLGARTIPGKISAIVFPITAFIAGGFEHCVANMYLVPLGMMIRAWGIGAAAGTPGALATAAAGADHLGWGPFLLGNLLPVTLGNIVGGAVMVGAVYWLVYRRPHLVAQARAAASTPTGRSVS